jgi:hypothetical protein
MLTSFSKQRHYEDDHAQQAEESLHDGGSYVPNEHPAGRPVRSPPVFLPEPWGRLCTFGGVVFSAPSQVLAEEDTPDGTQYETE